MILDIKTTAKGRLATITSDQGRTFDWGVYRDNGDAFAIQNGDVLLILDETGTMLERIEVRFIPEPHAVQGQSFSRKPDFPLDRWHHYFECNRYVRLTRETEEFW